VKAYESRALGDWGWWQWIGLYRELQRKFETREDSWCSWQYVANPTGGFLGFYWNWRNNKDGSERFLQLEYGKLCFKIRVNDKNQRGALRHKWHAHIMKKNGELEEPLAIRKPTRFGAGGTMTFCVLDNYRQPKQDNSIDIERTMELLEKATHLLNACAED